LKAYSVGLKTSKEKGVSDAVTYYQQAIELDPNFARGYLSLGNSYAALGETGRASEYITKAFQLRDHASELEKLSITSDYYASVTGELDKAVQAYKELLTSYPHDYRAHVGLGTVYAAEGQYENAMEAYSEALRLEPDSIGAREGVANSLLALQRFDEVLKTIHQARTFEGSLVFHENLYAIAFLRGDAASMVEQQQWFAGKPEENLGLALASDTEAYGGHLGKARELTKRVVDSAIRADSKETGAIWRANAALQQAAYGNSAESRQAAAEALKLAPASQGVGVEARLRLPWRATRHEPSPWHKTWGNAFRWTPRCIHRTCRRGCSDCCAGRPICKSSYNKDIQETLRNPKAREVMSPKRLVSSTTYKTRVALDKPCKEYQGILIGQPKDSCSFGCIGFQLREQTPFILWAPMRSAVLYLSSSVASWT
jgi:tetratricopeptide (TPR) repeat protein